MDNNRLFEMLINGLVKLGILATGAFITNTVFTSRNDTKISKGDFLLETHPIDRLNDKTR